MAYAPIISWRTVKTDNGFEAVVTRCDRTQEMQADGRYCITTELRRVGGFRTRARAKGHAVRLVRWFKAQEA